MLDLVLLNVSLSDAYSKLPLGFFVDKVISYTSVIVDRSIQTISITYIGFTYSIVERV